MTPRLTIEQLKSTPCAKLNENLFLNKKVKKSKYGNLIVTYEGKKFRSVKERSYYMKLRILEKAGEITDLRLQVPYELNPGGAYSYKYLADFVYTREGKTVVADTKGYRTKMYLHKKKLMLQVHGIEIKEV